VNGGGKSPAASSQPTMRTNANLRLRSAVANNIHPLFAPNKVLCVPAAADISHAAKVHYVYPSRKSSFRCIIFCSASGSEAAILDLIQIYTWVSKIVFVFTFVIKIEHFSGAQLELF